MGAEEDLATAAKAVRHENGNCDILVYQDASTAAVTSGYGVAVCSGPTFFASSGASPTNGDQMVTTLRSMIISDLH